MLSINYNSYEYFPTTIPIPILIPPDGDFLRLPTHPLSNFILKAIKKELGLFPGLHDK